MLPVVLTAGAQEFKPMKEGPAVPPVSGVPAPGGEQLEPELPESSLPPVPEVPELPPLPDRTGPPPSEPGEGPVPMRPVEIAPVQPRTGPAIAPMPAATVLPSGKVAEVPVAPKDSERTWSKEAQFIIDSPVGLRDERTAVFSAAGEVRRQVIAALGLPDKWLYPVHVKLVSVQTQPAGVKPIRFEPAQSADGFRLSLVVLPDHEAFTGQDLRTALVRCVLADLCLRGLENADLSQADVPPPDWLLHGTLELMLYREQGRPSEVFADVLRLGRVLSVQDLFDADPDSMDSVSATLYRVSCCGLLLMLLDQPGGPRQLASLLPDACLPGRNLPAVLARHFPGLNVSASSMQKWWALQIAVLASPGVDEMLDLQKTEKALAEALVFRFTPEPAPAAARQEKKGLLASIFGKNEPAPAAGTATGAAADPSKKPEVKKADSCAVTDYARIAARPDRQAICSRLTESLNAIRLRCHPLMRPVLDDYIALSSRMAEGKKSADYPKELDRLAKIRAGLLRTAQQSEDYLDWWLATQSTESTGEFNEALKPMPAPPPRRDKITRYMDAMEKEFEQGGPP